MRMCLYSWSWSWLYNNDRLRLKDRQFEMAYKLLLKKEIIYHSTYICVCVRVSNVVPSICSRELFNKYLSTMEAVILTCLMSVES